MLLSSRATMMSIDEHSAGPSSFPHPNPPPLSSKTSSRFHARPPVEKGKGVGKPWADGPWPLIETPSRTQRLTSAALHIANELAHAHNAMLRGLNAIYLQAPFVTLPGDVADLLFLTRAWSAWVLDHHALKETAMLPGFEAALGLAPGSLRRRRATTPPTFRSGGGEEGEEGGEEHGKSMENGNGNGKGKVEEAEDLALQLQRVHAYAASTLAQPASYSGSTLRALLASLAASLVPHLHDQISLLARMQDLSSSSSPSPFSSPSPSPYSSSSSTSSSIRPPPPSSASSSSSSARSLSIATAAAADRAAARANKLTQTHLSCESALADRADRFVVPPMVTRLRDAAYDGRNGAAAWPRLSVPALHAIADRLSPRHAGAWRFCPSDVWGRPRELGFLGGEGEGKVGEEVRE
ncbi:hypothetical protein F4820DRAFT_470636 [Hypoxylon rubiginosum]|uniref:Uncharacterized protein n=1 Tax=Hypoxylon rubiginosum TaxID=110542 RepID=A0ACB9YZ51_9PEZI|nr:hypothetical protein F4820DRAFT_470636 [Hypoxylon rubiginosum]